MIRGVCKWSGPRWLIFTGFLTVLATLAAPVSAAAQSGDVVLYATDVTSVSGNWARVSDGTAADGQKIASNDAGWASLSAPLANPSHYFQTTFTAAANTSYHVWLRLRATGDSKWNDSVWVQFNDSTSASGSPVYRIGTTNGLLVNLEGCTGCGVSGWGWQDGAHWLGQSAIVRFPTSGAHTIRVQTREDGVQIDQIVLSPSTYLSSAPGPAVNDNTIVAKDTGGSGGGDPLAWGGTAVSLPGVVEAENFDVGGPGLSYSDTTPGNAGGAYRATDVDIATCSEGGYTIGWMATGEWLNYTVNVTTPGAYVAHLRVAAPGSGGALHIGFNGSSAVWIPVSVPATGGWQTWTTVDVPMTLGAGRQQMTILVDAPGFNLHQISVTNGGGAPGTPTSPSPSNDASGIIIAPTLTWSASGATAYDVRFGTSNPPPLVSSNQSRASYNPAALSTGTRYYWSITARNASGATQGPVWSLVTQGGGVGTAVTAASWNIQVNDDSPSHAREAMATLMNAQPQTSIVVIQEAWAQHFGVYIDELQQRTGQTWYGVFKTHCAPGQWNGSTCISDWDQAVAIFSRFPITSTSGTFFPFPDCWTSARAGLRAAVDVNGIPVQVFTTHLQTGGCTDSVQARYNSMSMLKSWTSGYSQPQLLGGDFNADPDQIDTAAGMLPNFVDAWSVVGSGLGLTAFTPTPTMKLDYLFSDAGGRAQPNWALVYAAADAISDHRPIFTTFVIR